MADVFDAWLAGRTVRKHTMHLHRRENVAEHTWGVVMLLLKYVDSPSPELIRAAVTHDMGEQAVCDVPAHVCWDNPALKAQVQALEDQHVLAVMAGPLPAETHAPALSEDEVLALEAFDRAEFVLSCWYDFQMGNRFMLVPIHRATEKAGNLISKMRPSSLRTAAEQMHTDVLRVTRLAQMEKADG